MAGAYEDFFLALENDNERAVVELLARGFDPNSRGPEGQPALYLALRAGAAKTTQALLQHPQLRVDAVNNAGETPLMMAALKGRLDAMRQLLARGAAPHREGWTPLHYAATGPATEAVEMLLGKGTALDARAPNGNTPLMMAARYGAESSVALLLARGADPKLRNGRDQTAAELARGAGREKLAAELEARAR